MFHVQKKQLALSSLFKKPVHNALKHFSCTYRYMLHSYRRRFFFNQNILTAFFLCVEVLLSSQPSGVMLSEVSLPNHVFTGQA